MRMDGKIMTIFRFETGGDERGTGNGERGTEERRDEV